MFPRQCEKSFNHFAENQNLWLLPSSTWSDVCGQILIFRFNLNFIPMSSWSYRSFILVLFWFYPSLILVSSWFYPGFILILSRIFIQDLSWFYAGFIPLWFISVLSQFYPDFVPVLSRLCPNFTNYHSLSKWNEPVSFRHPFKQCANSQKTLVNNATSPRSHIAFT